MRALPAGVDSGAVVQALAGGWGLAVRSVEYAPVGGGSYHWVASEADGRRWFVTVDDLTSKPWLGDDPDVVSVGLGGAFTTAIAVKEAGLDFAVAPLRTRGGQPLLRLGRAHTVALFPFVDGIPGQFGQYSDAERVAALGMLTALHTLDPRVATGAPRVGLDFPERSHLDAALRDRHGTWVGGPLSEPARKALDRHASGLRKLLDRAERLAGRLGGRDLPDVVTHGEPHAANVLCRGGRSWLVDWDTVAVGPPERDLWLVLRGAPGEADAYIQATGHLPDADALGYFRLLWDLKDIAAFIRTLRAPHDDDEDTRSALAGLTGCLAARSLLA